MNVEPLGNQLIVGVSLLQRPTYGHINAQLVVYFFIVHASKAWMWKPLGNDSLSTLDFQAECPLALGTLLPREIPK